MKRTILGLTLTDMACDRIIEVRGESAGIGAIGLVGLIEIKLIPDSQLQFRHITDPQRGLKLNYDLENMDTFPPLCFSWS